MAHDSSSSKWPNNTNLRTASKVCLAMVTLVLLYYASFTMRVGRTSLVPFQIDREDFIDRWLNTRLLGPFNPAVIRPYCQQSTWRPNLIFHLYDADGGIGNFRAHFLDFLWYAMEMGASIVLPNTAMRNTDNLLDLTGDGERAPFRNAFDEAWFKAAIREACPPMRVYDPPKNASELGQHFEEQFHPVEVTRRRDTNRISWVRTMDGWLQDRGYEANSDKKYIVDMSRTMWQIDTQRLSPALRVNFGMLLRINPDVRRYAAIAMSNLAAVYGVHLNASERVHQRAFYGAHLRTESDAIGAGYTSGNCDESSCPLDFEAQTDSYIDAAREHGLRHIFVASGNQTEAENFKAKAAAQSPPLIVVDKWDLLPPEESRLLQAYHWDIQALVDYEIMMRCSVFGSISQSSFGWTIAVARTVWMDENGIVNDAMFTGDPLIAYDNGMNKLVGRNWILEGQAPVMFP
ncbi:Hypothetical predicted protein [Lecanosticta acicola]|uniref:Alternative oxidase n=1 Tax=Lecanosticta acicola TaxID=111012 RepID=A0AAI8Z9C6_9PEZI|nr:Hypothetical predicted protein [Lecanosticta acicola]